MLAKRYCQKTHKKNTIYSLYSVGAIKLKHTLSVQCTQLRYCQKALNLLPKSDGCAFKSVIHTNAQCIQTASLSSAFHFSFFLFFFFCRCKCVFEFLFIFFLWFDYKCGLSTIGVWFIQADTMTCISNFRDFIQITF